MALFKKNEPAKQPEKEAPEQPLDTARATLNELIDMLSELNQPAVQESMYRSAMANEAEAAKKAEAMKAAEEEKKQTGNEIFDKSELEKGLYIMPDDMQGYVNAVNGITQIFSGYSAAESVIAGADKIDVYLKDYIIKLKGALETGKKLKADACMDILKYAIKIAHKPPETTNEVEAEMVINSRIDFINGICRDLLQTIDSYYGHIKNIELEERSYRDAYDQFKQLDEKLQGIPQEDREFLDTLGFKKAMASLPMGDKRRECMPLIIAEQGAITKAMYRSLGVEENIMSAVILRNDIDELTIEFRKAFNTEGQTFNLAEHQKTMQKIRDRGMADINKMQKQISASHDMDMRLQSLIDEAASMPALGQNTAENLEYIRKMQRLDQKNAELTKAYSEHQAAVQKQKEEMKNQEIQNAQEENKILADMG